MRQLCQLFANYSLYGGIAFSHIQFRGMHRGGFGMQQWNLNPDQLQYELSNHCPAGPILVVLLSTTRSFCCFRL